MPLESISVHLGHRRLRGWLDEREVVLVEMPHFDENLDDSLGKFLHILYITDNLDADDDDILLFSGDTHRGLEITTAFQKAQCIGYPRKGEVLPWFDEELHSLPPIIIDLDGRFIIIAYDEILIEHLCEVEEL